MFSSIRGT